MMIIIGFIEVNRMWQQHMLLMSLLRDDGQMDQSIGVEHFTSSLAHNLWLLFVLHRHANKYIHKYNLEQLHYYQYR